jgi:hypothetical protein
LAPFAHRIVTALYDFRMPKEPNQIIRGAGTVLKGPEEIAKVDYVIENHGEPGSDPGTS